MGKINTKIAVKQFGTAVGYLIMIGELSSNSSQKEIAERMNANPTNVNYAIKGNERYLTESFLNRFNNSFGGIFSHEWLIMGKGEMLNDCISQTSKEISIGNSSGTSVNNSTNRVTIHNEDKIGQKRRETAQEQNENSLFDTINSLIAIKTQQGEQEKELISKLENVYNVISSQHEQLIDMNAKILEQNNKLLSIIDKIANK